MDVRCDKCSTEYEFDENRIGANGVTVKCTACGFVFKVRRPRRAPPPRATTTLGKGPQGREWLVRKPDGQMIAFRELTTLQKWIVEGRINRDDEISKNGETWKRLGNILELEPFFSVYEKARALNDLMEKGGDNRVEIRGSEVLATMNPLSQLPMDSEPPRPSYNSPPISADYGGASFSNTQRGTVPPYPVVQGSPLGPPPLHSSSADLSSTPVPLSPPPLKPSMSAHGTNGFGGNGTGSMSRRGTTPHGDTVPPFPKPSSGNNLGAISPADQKRASITPLGGMPIIDGPPPVERAMSRPPASWAGSSLSINLDDAPSSPDVSLRPEGGRGKRAFVWIAAIVVLGLGGGIALAKFGPTGNPMQEIAAKWGMLTPRVQDDGATVHIENANREFDLDTLASLAKAERLLEQAQSMRADDPKIKGDRALVMLTHADALRRAAADLGPAADDTSRAAIAKHVDQASALAKQAFELAAAAHAASADSYEAARALAEYYRVQQDYERFARELERAKALTAKSGATDGALMFIEAASLVTPSSAKAEDVARGVALAERALTARPSLNRARIMLARAQLVAKNFAASKGQLDSVLSVAPDHEEALRLRGMIEKASAETVAPVEPAPATAVEEKPAEAVKAVDKPADKAAPAETAPISDDKRYEQLMAEGDRSRERDRARKALASYEKAHDLRPASAEPLTGMGWAYIDLEKASAALSAFKRAIKANDRFTEAYFGQAEAYRMLGDNERAASMYQTYLDKAPTGPDRKAAERALSQLKAN
jgi:predicted Zn finger-like uncharacterized protein